MVDFSVVGRIGMRSFGEPVTWRRGGGAESTVTAVPDFRPLSQDPGMVAGASSTIVTLSLPASSLPGLDRLADRFVLRGRTYRAAAAPETDAAGMMVIVLEAV
ncbi:hypothetical protein [Niveispirillum fermenti]|uniref:head-tail joining protein n=1 Tax=Niveispirillum fermenti TaxID=1233113 RepID=UPI003A8784B0